jgi:hypothetical protein
MRKELGKIKRFDMGFGGYDDAMFGMSVTLGGVGWGVQDFDGTWTREPDSNCKWTQEDQTAHWGKVCRRVADLMAKAKVKTCEEMIGTPVEVTFNGNALQSWRILEEVL